LSRRAERRRRIEESFEVFRRAVAFALGAASREQRRVAVEHARTMFELWLRRAGVDRALEDREFGDTLHNPVLADRLDQALADRERAFAHWNAHGPARLAELVEAAAPGAASRPWQEWLGQPGEADGGDPETGVPELWRIGTAVVAAAPQPRSFPVAVPLVDHAHLHVLSTPDSRQVADALVESLLLRMLSYFLPGMVHVHAWDIGQLTGPLPGLYPLTRAGLLTVHDPTRLHELLDDLAEHIRQVHTNLLTDGHTSVRAAGPRGEPWRVAVLFGNRQALPEELQQKLQRVARNGLAAGVLLIVVDIPISVNCPIETVVLDGDHTARCTTSGPHAVVTVDGPLPRAMVPRACGVIADELAERRARVSTFADLLPAARWTESSASGLSAPVGFTDGAPVWLSLGDASPHALVGGPSGSGKTNFLYAMVGSLAARYSPDELELYLLDFKEGVSFAQFTPGRKDPSWLPHARLVGVNVNQDREFGLALLRFLAEEMRRRADAAKQHEVTKLEELRAEDPHGRWPRIVAVIDEFQYLFAERDPVTGEAVALLEDVARRGRSQGIHLLLSSQDVSGIEAFWGKPAIFEQFIVRIALPKARRVLVDHNDAAIRLPRWHAVVNHESGVRHGNEVARIPDATRRGSFDALQAELWQRRPEHLTEPRLFDGSHVPSLARLTDFWSLQPTGWAPTALLGQVIDVAGSAARVELVRTPGRNVAVVGSMVADAAGVLGAAALSLSRQHRAGEAAFTLGALVDDAKEPVDVLATRLRAAGQHVAVVELDDVREHLAHTAERLTERLTGSSADAPRPHYLVLFAVDAALTLLERKEQPGTPSGLDRLRHVLKHGPENRTHVLGWWRSVQRLKATLPVGSVDDIGSWVAFDVQGQDLSTLAPGQLVSWSPRPRRGLFFDRATHARPQVVIPFDVTEDTR
jgi:hypothetical protein